MTETGGIANLLAVIFRDGFGVETLEQACQACVAALSVSGAAISVVSGGAGLQALCASNAIGARLGEIEFTLGTGPSREAHTLGGPILVADLGEPGAGTEWPTFAEQAVESGALAVFAFPLQLGAIRLGVLGLYRDRPGHLSSRVVTEALLAADLLCLALLGRRDGSEGPHGREWPDLLADHIMLGRAEVHQATGAVMARLGVTAEEALVRLRGFAFAHELPLAEVAADVVAGRTVLDHN